MFVEDELKVDSFSVYQIPIPEAFKNATGDKRLVVALAFDPPVRRRRLDYLGAEMSFEVIKGCTSEKVISAFKKVAPGADAESIKQSNKVSFYPGTQPRGNIYNRKKSTLQKGETIFKRMNNVTDDTYWLVIRSERKWAPADYEVQRFAAVVRLESSDDRLYEQVKQRVKVKVRTRARS
jgi:hypothetical protein